MIRIILINILSIFPFLISKAQIQVIGKVIDGETKKPISEAYVKVLNGEGEAKTNFGGYFQITMDTSHHVIISSLGYKSSEVKITSARVQVSLIKIPEKASTLSTVDSIIVYSYLYKRVRYPIQAHRAKVQGRMYASFDIDKLGKIQNAKIVKDIGHQCGEALLQVLQKLPDVPASNTDRSFVLPVTLQLQGRFIKLNAVGLDVDLPKGTILEEIVLVGYGID